MLLLHTVRAAGTTTSEMLHHPGAILIAKRPACTHVGIDNIRPPHAHILTRQLFHGPAEEGLLSLHGHKT